MVFRASLFRAAKQSLSKVLPGQHAAAKGDRVVVLGSGWGGFQLALDINKNVPLTVVSPRNHFINTPLLPSASVGTLETRCIQEPVRTILGPNGSYLQAKARKLNVEQKKVICESVDHEVFELDYDKLVIAVGVKTNTFGIESIETAVHKGDDIFFLKQLAHARAMIRTHITDSFEKLRKGKLCVHIQNVGVWMMSSSFGRFTFRCW